MRGYTNQQVKKCESKECEAHFLKKSRNSGGSLCQIHLEQLGEFRKLTDKYGQVSNNDYINNGKYCKEVKGISQTVSSKIKSHGKLTNK